MPTIATSQNCRACGGDRGANRLVRMNRGATVINIHRTPELFPTRIPQTLHSLRLSLFRAPPPTPVTSTRWHNPMANTGEHIPAAAAPSQVEEDSKIVATTDAVASTTAASPSTSPFPPKMWAGLHLLQRRRIPPSPSPSLQWQWRTRCRRLTLEPTLVT